MAPLTGSDVICERRGWRRAVVIGLATGSLLVAAFTGGPAAAQTGRQSATLVGERADGYGRMILTFPGRSLLPEYSAKTANGILKIEFQDSVNVAVERIPLDLSGYISVARRDPDGGAIRFGLAQPLRVNTMEAGEKLFIDLLPANWSGMTPGLPNDVVQELARRAEKALRKVRENEQRSQTPQIVPRMDMRVGRHPTFSRFVFGWNVPFDTTFVREDHVVTIGFNHTVDLDLSDTRAHLPPGMKDITRFADGDGRMRIVMTVDPTADIRAFRDGHAYVVDVTPRSADVSADGADPVETAIKQAMGVADETTGRTAAVNAPGRDERSTGTDAPEANQADDPIAETVSTQSVAQTTAKPVVADATAGDKPPESMAGEVATATVEPVAAVEPAPAKAEPVPEATADKPAVRLGSLPSKDQPTDRPSGHSPEGGLHSDGNRGVNVVHGETAQNGAEIVTTFQFEEAVAAASFWRNNSLWLVFDTDAELDLRSLKTAVVSQVDNTEHIEFGTWQAIRLEFKRRALTTLTADGNKWDLMIGNTIRKPAEPIEVKRVVRGDGGHVLRLPVRGIGRIHQIQDPVVGDILFIATAFAPERGIIKPQSFVELDILPSSHGIAVVTRADGVVVTRDDDTLVLHRGGGLSLSAGASSDSGQFSSEPGRRNQGAFYDFRSLTTANPAMFRDRSKMLFDLIGAAAAEDRLNRQLDLAKFFMAHRFAFETLGLLRLAAGDYPDLERNPTFNILMGAANALARRPKLARVHLSRPELRDNADAAVWRTIAEVQLQDWSRALRHVRRGQTVIGNYPLDLQAEFDLAGAQAAIEVNDFGTASELLSEIDADRHDRSIVARYDLLRARVAERSGRPGEALTLYTNVLDSGDRPSAAEAEYRQLKLRYRDGLAKTEEVLGRLDRLTTTWRGDDTELLALRFFAELSAAAGHFRRAFEAMKAAIVADPDATVTQLIQDDMNAVFAGLFLEGQADTMPAVEALALYYDFRELTPVGRRGDEMVRRLATRLVAVDLLGQASDLLRHQVENRLKGSARAQIAADLAVIYMLDNRPELALQTIGKTRQAQLPTALERQRRLVEARAHAEIGRHDIALEILKSLNGPDADRLRANTLWSAKHWQRAGEALELMHGSLWSDARPMTEDQVVDVLRAGIAFTLAGDDLSLDRLRTKYAAKMSDTPHASAFDVVTERIDNQGLEFKTILRQIAAIDTMSAFLEDYRRQYLETRMEDLPTGDRAAARPLPLPAENNTENS